MVLPDSLEAMGANPFYACKTLTDISVSPEHRYFRVRDGVLYTGREGTLVCYPCGFTDAGFTMPSGTRGIGSYAFYGCTALKTITVPETVASLGDHAFGFCSGLENITLSEGLKEIDDFAFCCFG